MSRSAHPGVRGRRLGAALALLCALACSAGRPSQPAPPDAAGAAATVLDELPPPALEPSTLSAPDRSPRPPALRLLQEGRFTLDVQGADLRGLLAGLVRSSPFSLVVSPEVSGEVTADLRAVSLYDILEQVVVPRGYAYQVSDALIRVGPPRLESRTYHVAYPSYKREGNSDLTLNGAIETAPDLGTGTTSTAADASASTLATTQQLDFWGELKTSLDALVTRGATDGERQVLVAEQSGLVVVRAEPDVLAEVEDLLSEMEHSNQQQVLIDTRIVEVTLSDDLDLGVDLEFARSFKGSTSGALARLIDPTRRAAVITTNISPALVNGGFTFGIASDSLSARLRALAAQTDVRVVSTPRVATLNNHKALIKVVRNQVFFVAETDVQIVEGVGTSVTTEFVPRVIPIGVTLDVTPRISEEHEITLHIHPSVSEIVAVQNQPSTDPNALQTGSLPVVDLRETDTVVRVRDGETIVIGGLMRSRNLDQESKVPFLGDLPLLGHFFRSTNVEELRTELIILLTPRVLEGPRVYRVADQARSSQEALNQLRLERRPLRPWWRVPRGASYGAP
jgi:MSHA biogenesis protein MshL